MRAAKPLFGCGLLLALLAAACAGGDRQEEIEPRFLYDYRTLDGARAVAALADERCDAATGGDALLLESDPEPAGYRVAFVCR